MFHVQYQMPDGEHKMVEVKARTRIALAYFLTRTEHPIAAVYEGTCVITKAMQSEVTKWGPYNLTNYAKDFANFL